MMAGMRFQNSYYAAGTKTPLFVVKSELPDKVTLYNDEEEIDSDDSVESDDDDGYTIQCGVEGDVEPQIAIFAGGQRIMGAEEDDCKLDD